MADMFKDQIVEDFGTGTDAIWHNQKVRVVAVIPPKSRTIEYRVPDETKPLTRIVDVSELSPLGASPYVQVETANEPVAGIPIPPRDPAKPLTEDEKLAALRDIMGEDDEPDASDAYSEAMDELRAEKARLELDIQRLKDENKLYLVRAQKAEDNAAKQAFNELEFHKSEVLRWKGIADEAQRELTAMALKPVVYDPQRERYFHMDMVDVSHKVRVIGYAPLESAVQFQTELEKLRFCLVAWEAGEVGNNAPPDAYIALSEAEIAAAETEDRVFMTCWRCGWLSEDVSARRTMVPIKTARCNACGKVKPVRMAFKADGIWHHYCNGCWEAERETFLQRLIQDDNRAYRILDAVVSAVADGVKPRPKTDD